MPDKKEDQKNLFGDADFLFNTLHTELTIINEDIERLRKSINSKEKTIEKLKERKEQLEKAAKIARSHQKPTATTPKKDTKK